MPGPCEFQQQPAADHVAQGAVGLSPSPRLAQTQRKLPPIGLRMLCDELADELHFRCRDHPAPIAKFSFHARQRSRVEIRTQGPALLFLNSEQPPVAMPAPPAWRSGRLPPTTLAVDAPPDSAPPRAHSALPATSENALWITASARARIPGRHRPRMRIAVPRRLRKTNRQPEKGSVCNRSWHNCASESIPLRPSTGSTATRMRICGVIWIMLRHPTRLGSKPPTRPGPRP